VAVAAGNDAIHQISATLELSLRACRLDRHEGGSEYSSSAEKARKSAGHDVLLLRLLPIVEMTLDRQRAHPCYSIRPGGSVTRLTICRNLRDGQLHMIASGTQHVTFGVLMCRR
jgi:hypothetical protein